MGRSREFSVRGWLVIILVLGGGVVHPATALADCSTEEVLFAYADATDADGNRNTFDIKDRDLGCGSPEAHSTAHMRSTSGDKLAEIGYVERLGPNNAHLFNVFWEIGIADVYTGGFNTGPSVACCVSTEFKVVSIPGTSNWTFFFDYKNTGSWTKIGPDGGVNAAFTAGKPMGETGRRGETGTGASDDHRNMEKKNCGSCDWINWRDNSLSTDTISNWHYRYIDPNHYEVVKDS